MTQAVFIFKAAATLQTVMGWEEGEKGYQQSAQGLPPPCSSDVLMKVPYQQPENKAS